MNGIVQWYQEASRLTMLAALGAAVVVACFFTPWPLWVEAAKGNRPGSAPASTVTQGSLITVDDQGRPRDFCPLKHTDVKLEISGFLARARVTQQFENPFSEKIEAVYTFPLPQNAAVDEMTLTVGDRVVKAKIKLREEAQAIYEAARTRGHVAGLLDQERPNIFTQAIANILPGEKVTVTISYVQRLTYEAGSYELSFPMVVGPRYIPGAPSGKQGGGWAPDTDRVPDGSRITPPVTAKGTRAGHDLSLDIDLDAGLPLDSVQSPSHDIAVERPASGRAHIRLADQAAIPNKDFVLKYAVVGRKIQDAILTHRNGHDGFVTLILQPPDRVNPSEITPKELVFVLDTSGSMEGFPIEKAKETMKLAMEGLYSHDTFNLITFSGDTHILFPDPVPATKENVRKALAFLESRQGSGGTEMMKAIRAALDPSDAQDHVRIVCFMTDGYVGNDMEIIGEIQRHPNARVFAFGIGSSINRFLLHKMAEYGRGEVEYVGLKDDGSAAARRFHERVRNPLLTDLSVEWGDLRVTEVYPKQVPDLFTAKPVVVTARYSTPGKGIVRLRGKLAGRTTVREVPVELPVSEPKHDVLATLWARTRIDDLMGQDFSGIQSGQPKLEVRKAIAQLGLDYRLLTQYTSFVAVEEMTVTEGGQPRRIDVPVEMPEGVSYEGIFGHGERDAMTAQATAPLGIMPSPVPGYGGGFALRKSAPVESLADVDRRRLVEPSDAQGPRVAQRAAKLHPHLAAVVERLRNKGAKPGPEETLYVHKGKADVQIWLTDTSLGALAQLEELGIEILAIPKTANLVLARVPVEKLEALIALKAVRYVTPQTASS